MEPHRWRHRSADEYTLIVRHCLQVDSRFVESFHRLSVSGADRTFTQQVRAAVLGPAAACTPVAPYWTVLRSGEDASAENERVFSWLRLSETDKLSDLTQLFNLFLCYASTSLNNVLLFGFGLCLWPIERLRLEDKCRFFSFMVHTENVQKNRVCHRVLLHSRLVFLSIALLNFPESHAWPAGRWRSNLFYMVPLRHHVRVIKCRPEVHQAQFMTETQICAQLRTTRRLMLLFKFGRWRLNSRLTWSLKNTWVRATRRTNRFQCGQKSPRN